MKRFSIFALGALAALGLATRAEATTITGHIGFSGGILYDTLDTSGSATLDFAPLGGTTGTVITIDAVTDYFANTGGGIPAFPSAGTDAATVTILDLTNNAALDPTDTFAPAGVPLNIVGFLSAFTSPILPAFYQNLRFDLTEVVVQGFTCTGSEGVGDTCQEGPFTITQSVNGLTIDFNVLGNFVNGADSGAYKGTFDMTLNGMTFATLFNKLDVLGQDVGCDAATGFTTTCTFSGNFDPVSAVPEPATLVTFGIGSAVLAGLRRRRNRKNQIS